MRSRSRLNCVEISTMYVMAAALWLVKIPILCTSTCLCQMAAFYSNAKLLNCTIWCIVSLFNKWEEDVMVVRIAVMLPVANEAGNAGNAFTGVCLSMGVGGGDCTSHTSWDRSHSRGYPLWTYLPLCLWHLAVIRIYPTPSPPRINI